MSQTKTCTRCDLTTTLSFFKRWDAICKACRLEVGPRKRAKKRPPWGGTRPIHSLPKPPRPKPSGRSARRHATDTPADRVVA